MKSRTLISFAIMAYIVVPLSIQAETTPTTIKTLEVECSSKTYFTDNKCDICQDGGEITTNSTTAIINAQELTWENSLTGINQNFYKSGQPSPEIKTNIGSPSVTWDQAGLDWGTDVIFTKVDIQNIFSLEAGKTVKIKTIADKTNIPITSIKDTVNPYLMVKIPISYYELAMGATSQGDKKTTNYCISYTPKISTTASTTTNTTTPITTPPTTTTPVTTTTPPITPVTPLPKPTTVTTTPPATTPTPTTPPSATTTVPPKQIAIPTAATTTNTTPPVTAATTTPPPTLPPKPIADTTTTGIVPTSTSTNTAIPSYNPTVPLNSAGNDPKLSNASKVASGPAENMYIFIAAILLSAILYPKIRKIRGEV